jgi:hypothetical protein
MPISAQVFRPFFAARYPSGTYTIRLLNGSTPIDTTVNLTNPHYLTKQSTASYSLPYRISLALNANVAVTSVFGTIGIDVSSVSNATGFIMKMTQTIAGTPSTLSSPAGFFDWSWLGFPTGVPSIFGEHYSSTNARGTWFPFVLANDLGQLPSPAQVSFSAMTANGSVAVIDMSGDPTSMPKWWTMQLDGTVGVHGARMQRYRTAKAAWASSIGVATDAPYVPLDYPGGWWSYAIRGTQFLVGDMDANASDVQGLRIHSGPECPEGMDPFKGLRSPVVSMAGPAQGRRNIRLAFLTS